MKTTSAAASADVAVSLAAVVALVTASVDVSVTGFNAALTFASNCLSPSG